MYSDRLPLSNSINGKLANCFHNEILSYNLVKHIEHEIMLRRKVKKYLRLLKIVPDISGSEPATLYPTILKGNDIISI